MRIDRRTAMPTDKLITIDTDNAVIRFYLGRARELGVDELATLRIRRDLETVALGLANAHETTYHVEVVL